MRTLDWHGKVTDMPTNGDYIAIRCQPITRLVNFAFSDLGPYQLKNEPEWVDTEPYDCLAKIAPADIATWQKMTLGSKRLMVRIMLADALNLKMHIEQQPRPIYALVVAKDGPKLTEHKPGPDDPPPGSITLVHAGAHWVSPDEVAYTNASMRDPGTRDCPLASTATSSTRQASLVDIISTSSRCPIHTTTPSP